MNLILPHRLTSQPQYAAAIDPTFVNGLVWLTCPSMGRGNLAPRYLSTSSVPTSRLIDNRAGSQGYEFVPGFGGDNPTQSIASLGATNQVTFFSVIFRTGTSAYAGILYDRNGGTSGFNGMGLSSDGASYLYVWNGPESNANLGFGPTRLNAVSVMAHSIFPDKAIFTQDGRTLVATGLTNQMNTFYGGDAWFGQDNLDTGRTFPGSILMAGIVVGDPWGEAKLRSFSLNPWQIFKTPQSIGRFLVNSSNSIISSHSPTKFISTTSNISFRSTKPTIIFND